MEDKEWKGLLSVPEIEEKLYDKGFTEGQCEAIIFICKRAGRREVVDFVNELLEPNNISDSGLQRLWFGGKWEEKQKEWRE